MSIDHRASLGRYLWWGAGVSVAIHVLIAAVVAVLIVFSEDEPAPPEEPESMEVVLEDPPPEEVDFDELVDEELSESVDEVSVPVDDPEQPEEDDEEQQQQEEEEDEQPEESDDREEPDEDPEPIDEQHFERYAVEQVTDDVEPDQADHISDEAHRTDEETVSETTTLEDVEPTDDPEALEQEADTDREYAMETPEEPIEEPDLVDPTEIADADEDEGDDDEDEGDDSDTEDDASDVEDDAVAEQEETEDRQQYRDPSEMIVDDGDEPASEFDDDIDHRTLFSRDAERAAEVLDTEQGDQSDGSDGEASGRRLLSNWRENEEALRASLENFLPHVQPGNHTSVNAHAADHASYIARLHRTIHANWGDGFLPRIQRSFSNAHPLNDMSLEMVVEIVIDADSGDVVETGRVETSGSEMFDAAALNVARQLGDQPEPPESMVSPDGNAYIHWRFWRDVRQCGTFGVRLYRLQDESERRSVD